MPQIIKVGDMLIRHLRLILCELPGHSLYSFLRIFFVFYLLIECFLGYLFFVTHDESIFDSLGDLITNICCYRPAFCAFLFKYIFALSCEVVKFTNLIVYMVFLGVICMNFPVTYFKSS